MHEFLEEDEAEWRSPWKHMLAGAVAGTAEHCGMFPLDTIKTHAQTMGRSASMREISRSIYAQHGMRGFFFGLPALISGAAPAHALFFGAYEFTKHRLGGNMAGHHPLQVAVAGMCATVAMDGVLTPMDAVKQRMQLTNNYRNVLDCIAKTRRGPDGLRSLYAGYTTTLTMNVPYHALFFASYESYKILLRGRSGAADSSDDSVTLHLSAGACAGITAAAATNPLDVAKTRLQTQHEIGKRYRGMVHALATISREEGLSGLLRGIGPRMLLHSMSAAIVWAVYEGLKHRLESSDAPIHKTYTHIDPGSRLALSMSGISEPAPPAPAKSPAPPPPFKLSTLLQRADPNVPVVFPPEVLMWAYCTPTALVAGMMAGAFRGAALGNALARVAIEKRRVLPQHQQAVLRTYTSGEMARGSLRNGFRMGAFVGIFLGADVVALEYPALKGPLAPTIGGFMAGLAMSWRKGAAASVSGSLLGALMGLSYGIARKAVDMDKVFQQP